MSDQKSAKPRDISDYVTSQQSAIPRMGMSIPMPASTKPPAVSASQQNGSNAKPRDHK
jgi:hypothetical protein